jgi:hypothetical protein
MFDLDEKVSEETVAALRSVDGVIKVRVVK